MAVVVDVDTSVQEVEAEAPATVRAHPTGTSRLPVLTTVADYRRVAEDARAAGRRVGVVPTMGALHAGHCSLIERASEECDVVIVTLFVNPTQFGESADLVNYPRTFDADLDVAAAAGAAFVFAPSVDEMYPDGLRTVPVPPAAGAVTGQLEGASRPGHFDGVATVVPRLLEPAGRCRAYFGEKDFQQLTLVRRLLAELDLAVEVVGCDTVRDPDGLALSSRNVRMSPDERRAALALVRALRAGAEAMAVAVAVAGGSAVGPACEPACGDGAAVEAVMAAVIEAEPLVELDYAACVQADSLEPVGRLAPTVPVRLLVAAQVGPVRLIDNLDPRRPLPPLLAGHQTVR
jgi:pantoate--beta-alanine ligase